MMRVFVHEVLSGGGRFAGEPPAAELMAEGRAMRDALVADLAGVAGVAVSYADGAAVGSAGSAGGSASATPLHPRPGETAIDLLRRLAPQFDHVWVVAPETDRLLLTLHEVVGTTRWIGCDADAIRLASSKQATLARLAQRGVCTPLAFAERTPEQSGVSRWVVKPDDGAGSLDTRLHDRHGAAKADWTARMRAGLAAVIEPWVEGQALSLTVLCPRGGQGELAAVNRQHVEVDADGRLRFEGVTPNAIPPEDPRTPALRTIAAQVARALPGLRGLVGIDLVWHARRGPVVIEVNPRLTSAYVGMAAALGRNLAAEVLAGFAAEAPHAA